jgi:hypothetical protein
MMQFHAVYLQRRRPGVSYRDFQRLWRSHGDYAASIPAFWDHVERYVHNDPVEDAAGLPGDTAAYDAVGELSYPSYETWLSLRDVMWNEIAPDEKRVFAGPSTAVRGDRTVFLKASGGPFKLFTFAKLRPGVDPADGDRILARHAETTLRARGFGGRLAGFAATRARRHAAETKMDAIPATTSNKDVVFIHHFVDECSARAAVNSAGYARVVISEEGFLDFESRIVVLTRGWLLKGTPD